MAITTYSELKTAIANWTNKTTLTSYLGDFIMLAEQEINKHLRVIELEERATASASTTVRYLELPARFAGMKRLQLNTSPVHRLEYVPPSKMNDLYEEATGRPYYFTINGGEIEFNRICDTAYSVEMSFWQKVSPLSDSNTSNSILTAYPNIYLAGALVETYRFLKDMQQVGVWEEKFSIYINSANGSDEWNHTGELRLQMRSDRI